VLTASANQVRHPIYRDAVAPWKKYKPYMPACSEQLNSDYFKLLSTALYCSTAKHFGKSMRPHPQKKSYTANLFGFPARPVKTFTSLWKYFSHRNSFS
jgi:hypothetical protein